MHSTAPLAACSHRWIDPLTAPFYRVTISPVLGPLPREMKPGRRYVCQECGGELLTPAGAPGAPLASR
jgi:hypothetical protein